MLEGRHYQNAYVTRNLEAAVSELTARADVRSAVTFEAATEVLTGEGRKRQTLKMAFIWAGDLQTMPSGSTARRGPSTAARTCASSRSGCRATCLPR